jgi:hypothetical protein
MIRFSLIDIYWQKHTLILNIKINKNVEMLKYNSVKNYPKFINTHT